MKPYGYIYKFTNIFNELVYIGQTIQEPKKRWQRHMCDAIKEDEWYLATGENYCKFHKALIEFGGLNSFIKEVIDTAYSREELNEKEIYWIAENDSFKHGYNSTLGGEGGSGYKHTPEACEKISKGKQGNKNPAKKKEVREKISKTLTGEHNPNYGKYGVDHNKSKAIKMTHLDTGHIMYFGGCSEAGRKIGKSKSQVSTSLKEGKSVLGYHSEIVSKEEYLAHKDDTDHFIKTTIRAYDFKTGEFYKEYENIREGAKDTGADYSTIAHVVKYYENPEEFLKHRKWAQKQAKGYIWKKYFKEVNFMA